MASVPMLNLKGGAGGEGEKTLFKGLMLPPVGITFSASCNASCVGVLTMSQKENIAVSTPT